jgi:hypothetical protein
MTRSFGGRTHSQPTRVSTTARRGSIVVVPNPAIDDRPYIYMIGADDGAGGSPARRYDILLDQWVTIASPPVALSGSVLVQNQDVIRPNDTTFFMQGLYLTGGTVGGVPNARAFVYKVFDDSYIEVATAPLAGFRAGSRSLSDHLDTDPTAKTLAVLMGGAPGDDSLWLWDFPFDDYHDTTFDVADVVSIWQAATPMLMASTGASWRYSDGGAEEWVPNVSSNGAVAGTATDSIRAAYGGTHPGVPPGVNQGDQYAIRVQGGVATTWQNLFSEGWVNERTPLPRPRENFGVAWHAVFTGTPDFAEQNFIYVVGGDGTPWLDIYHPETDTWTQGADLDVGVSNVACEKVFVAGL